MPELSPMMSQYMQIKEQNEDCIIFFRLGDFYEMFFDDAKTASAELELTLTGRDCGLEERAPMCGVPYHSCEGYIARLVDRGYKVAICEQTEDPAKAKGLVKREIVRIITPGTVIEDTMLDEARNNYLAGVFIENQAAGLCFADASTGESHVTEVAGQDYLLRVVDELMRFRPSEIILTKEASELKELSEFFRDSFEGAVTIRENESFDKGYTRGLICEQFSVISPENLGVADGSLAVCALGAVIDYLKETGKMANTTLNSVEVYTESQFMRLDMTALRNLEISETMRSKSKKGSLLWV
ncbi:MAG: DNA mismatch repair protein MutS, partial [Oscillospiraceae bacterium]|nr:DNA mismatch repair protein MutS [Oscillospiraceae bacterium]